MSVRGAPARIPVVENVFGTAKNQDTSRAKSYAKNRTDALHDWYLGFWSSKNHSPRLASPPPKKCGAALCPDTNGGFNFLLFLILIFFFEFFVFRRPKNDLHDWYRRPTKYAEGPLPEYQSWKIPNALHDWYLGFWSSNKRPPRLASPPQKTPQRVQMLPNVSEHI